MQYGIFSIFITIKFYLSYFFALSFIFLIKSTSFIFNEYTATKYIDKYAYIRFFPIRRAPPGKNKIQATAVGLALPGLNFPFIANDSDCIKAFAF